MHCRRLFWAALLSLGLAGCRSLEDVPVDVDWSVLKSYNAARRRVLVLAPHPDDEVLIGAGVIHAALQKGDPVYVAIATNGDWRGVDMGLRRESESVQALAVLGLPEEHVIFLGYGDQSLSHLSFAASVDPAKRPPYRARSGAFRTYAQGGLGHQDFHSWLTGAPANYSGENFVRDLVQLLKYTQATEVYTTSVFDQHPDHKHLSLHLLRALARLHANQEPVPDVFEAIVHFRVNGKNWGHERFEPDQNWEVPPALAIQESRRGVLQSFPLPADMAQDSPQTHLKARALSQFSSQSGAIDFMLGFVKQDEVFWLLQAPR